MERIGPIASLKRSAELTGGSRWLLFALALLVLLASVGAALLSLQIFVLSRGSIVGLFCGLLIQGAFTGYLYCLSAAVYQELKNVKEGSVSPAALVVFD